MEQIISYFKVWELSSNFLQLNYAGEKSVFIKKYGALDPWSCLKNELLQSLGIIFQFLQLNYAGLVLII